MRQRVMWSGVILGFFGMLTMGYGLYAWQKGEVRMGSKGFTAYTPTREDNPTMFYFGVLLYVAFGGWMVAYGAMVLLGKIPPLSFG